MHLAKVQLAARISGIILFSSHLQSAQCWFRRYLGLHYERSPGPYLFTSLPHVPDVLHDGWISSPTAQILWEASFIRKKLYPQTFLCSLSASLKAQMPLAHLLLHFSSSFLRCQLDTGCLFTMHWIKKLTRIEKLTTDLLLTPIPSSTTHPLLELETVVRVGATGLLEVYTSALVERGAVEPEGALSCEVTIPKTDFYLREELELFEYPSKSHFPSASTISIPLNVIFQIHVGNSHQELKQTAWLQDWKPRIEGAMNLQVSG